MSDSDGSAPLREFRLVVERRPEYVGLAGEAATLICEGLGLGEPARLAIGDATTDALAVLDTTGEVEVSLRIVDGQLEIELRGGSLPADPASDPRLARARAAVDSIAARQSALVLRKKL